MTSLSLVAQPATLGAPVVHELLGNVRTASRDAWRLRDPLLADILTNAAANRNGTSRIVEPCPPEQTPTMFERRMSAPSTSSGRKIVLPDGTLAELEYRPARIVAVAGRPVSSRR